jgi:hypothetical protein
MLFQDSLLLHTNHLFLLVGKSLPDAQKLNESELIKQQHLPYYLNAKGRGSMIPYMI